MLQKLLEIMNKIIMFRLSRFKKKIKILLFNYNKNILRKFIPSTWPCYCSKQDVEGDDEGQALARKLEVHSVVWATLDPKLLPVGVPCWPSFRVL